METTNNVSPELRKIEKEIDGCYKSNPLVKLPFATAAWFLLAFGENWGQMQTRFNDGMQFQAIIADNLVNELKYPIYWLYQDCKTGGQVPFAYDRKFFQASSDLFKLGQEYRWFVAAYTHAGLGWIGLELQETTIRPTTDFSTGIEYEAYNRLIKPQKLQEALSSVNSDELPSPAVKVTDDRFRYNLNPKIVSGVIRVMKPIYDALFSLPSEWQFSCYTLGDFQKVFEAILAIAHIRWIARMIAIDEECRDFGCADSIYVPTYDELRARVAIYSGMSDTTVRSILDDLTYGNRNISHPDPALQPLIKLSSKHYAIMPHLWMSLSPERNLTVLFNRIPSERKIYAELVDEKECLMRQHFIDDLSDKVFRFVNGNVSGLPDIDLAIIRDSEKACLLLELKCFIDPAEMREIIEKSEELEKGISQVIKFKQAFFENHKPLLEKLNIDLSYRFEGVVVSENWIGHTEVQNPKVPIIRADHLLARLKVTESLQSTMEWLKDRKYLPKEGEHFNIHRFTPRVGKYHLKWYGIKPLIKDAFFPL